ncbi:MAG: hypothetical protein DMF61_20410 [Blastocatellia bacterium AA13]|nr:MAG: hypothetical protein DMF61_20410 [Blastocatellia bacterium AA13]
MAAETNSIKVEPDVANAYNSASQEDQQKIQLLIRLWLQEFATLPSLSLTEVMDLISDRAQSRGLTPEILDSILNEG